MPFAAAMSQHPLATHAVGEVVGEVLDRLGDRPDAAVVFVTSPFAGAMEDIAAAVRTLLRPKSLIGCSASSVLAGDREVEGGAAISLFAMRFGPQRRFDTGPLTHVIRLGPTPNGGSWRLPHDDDAVSNGGTLVLLGDPFSTAVESLISQLADQAPALTIVGGLASGATGPGGSHLVAGEDVFTDGAVGLLIPPGVGATAVVSQGCEPVGEALVITKATGNLIEELGGQPALDRLLAQAAAATPLARRAMADGIQVGLVIDERKAQFERGDFLVRAVLGADHTRRAVALDAPIEVGTTVQFQVRNAASAEDDLRELLADADGDAALVFTDTGRGTSLFGHPHQDATAVSRHLDGGPVAGMFCAGEIGPLGDRHHLHTLSASVLLFDDAG